MWLENGIGKKILILKYDLTRMKKTESLFLLEILEYWTWPLLPCPKFRWNMLQWSHFHSCESTVHAVCEFPLLPCAVSDQVIGYLSHIVLVLFAKKLTCQSVVVYNSSEISTQYIDLNIHGLLVNCGCGEYATPRGKKPRDDSKDMVSV